MRNRIVRILVVCVVALACAVGCRPLAAGRGSLVLKVPTGGVQERTIAPSLDLDIAYYDVHGQGPEAAEFTRSGVTGSPLLQEHLAAGPWTITVEAFNTSDVKIGTGTVSLTVTAGETISQSVEIGPLAGTGNLDIAVLWPAGAIADPGILGTLTPVGGSPQTLSFTLGVDAFSCSCSSLSTGYHSLILQLLDGAVVEWGSFEAVRILNGESTTAGFELTIDDLLSGS